MAGRNIPDYSYRKSTRLRHILLRAANVWMLHERSASARVLARVHAMSKGRCYGNINATSSITLHKQWGKKTIYYLRSDRPTDECIARSDATRRNLRRTRGSSGRAFVKIFHRPLVARTISTDARHAERDQIEISRGVCTEPGKHSPKCLYFGSDLSSNTQLKTNERFFESSYREILLARRYVTLR